MIGGIVFGSVTVRWLYVWQKIYQPKEPKPSIKIELIVFFAVFENVLVKVGATDKPALIYNCDETGLSTVPAKGRKVLAQKGQKQVSQLQVGKRGVLTTILPCCNACGDFIPPFIIFKGPNTPDIKDFPASTALHATKSGYIDKETFLEF